MRNAIVLAAGKGTRMKSDRSKVMHTIIDRSMLTYIIDALRAVSVQRIVMIVGYQAESIKEAFPEMDGYEATRMIREMDLNVPIVAMTANAFAEDKIKAKKAGMNAHVSKPLDKDILIRVISKLCGYKSV